MINKIYALRCPIDKTPKYIGSTSKSLDKRLFQHISMSAKGSHAKNEWIGNLIDAELKPTIELIEEVEAEYAEKAEIRERWWIKHYADLGIPLLNVANNPNAPKPYEIVTINSILKVDKKLLLKYSVSDIKNEIKQMVRELEWREVYSSAYEDYLRQNKIKYIFPNKSKELELEK